MRAESFTDSLRKVQQCASHAHLYQRVSRSLPLRPSSSGRIDAIIVPASRPAPFLQRTIELSAAIGILLVILCSKQTKIEHVAQRVAKTDGARSLIVEIPDAWTHPTLPSNTSAPAFLKASAHRENDLSAKRNIGLLLARLRGWNKVVFVDDDINSLDISNVVGLARQLEHRHVAGMRVHHQRDNSVVCHARQLAGQWQDIFVTGAVLGVQCSDLPLSFFPDIYNEDWFFFAKEAAARDLPNVGHVTQAWYDPFASADRARKEEFGDLLAEGLYALIGRQDASLSFNERLRRATKTYWSYFIEARHQVITETQAALHRLIDHEINTDRALAAVNSLAVAESQLDMITADLCVDFIDAWREDMESWQRSSDKISNVRSTREAMDFLQLKAWSLVEFGDEVGSRNGVVELEAPATTTKASELDAKTGIVELKLPIFDAQNLLVAHSEPPAHLRIDGSSETKFQSSLKPPSTWQELALAGQLET